MKITLHHVVDGTPCLVKQTRKAGGGGLTSSQQSYAVFTASGSTIALSPGSSYLATVCQRACLPPVLPSPPKQKGWLITPSCCMPIKYYYSCFVYEKKKGQEKKLWRVPGNVCGFGTSVKDLCPWLARRCLKKQVRSSQETPRLQSRLVSKSV